MAAIDLYLVAGQSNAEGRGDAELSPSVDPAYGYEYNGGSTILSLADPVGGATDGSAWPSFANAVLARRLRPLCITESASGSSALIQASGGTSWSTAGTLFAAAIVRAEDALDELVADGWTPTLRAILWCQGESDAVGYPGTPTQLEDDYYTDLLALHDRFKAELGPVPMCVFRLGHEVLGDDPRYAAIRAAQDQACADRVDMHMVFTGAVDFAANGMMADTYHYTQAGYNLMGTEGGEAVARVIYGPPLRKSRIQTGTGRIVQGAGAAVTQG